MRVSDTRAIPRKAREIDTTNFCACAASAGLFTSLLKILEELWKIHVSLPHASLKFKLRGSYRNFLVVKWLILNIPVIKKGTGQ